jgi:ADP-ribosylglycohydrolase
MKDKTMFDRFQGCIHGLAIGDALGYPVEFLTLDEIRTSYGRSGITEYGYNDLNLSEGTYSDDTQMTLAVADALLASKSDSVDEIMENVSREFLKWRDSPDNDRAPGNTCMQGLFNLSRTKSWKTSGLDSLGCGAAMRTAPIGLIYHDNPEKLKEIATASSVITHNNPASIASAIANAYLVSRAIQGQDPGNLEALIEFTKDLSPVFTQKIRQINQVENYSPDTALKTLGQGWHGHEAVALALYCLKKNEMDFEKSVIMGANTDGDSDSIASIAGGIAGAYCGYLRIPKRLLRGLENRKGLYSTSGKLYNRKFED